MPPAHEHPVPPRGFCVAGSPVLLLLETQRTSSSSGTSSARTNFAPPAQRDICGLGQSVLGSLGRSFHGGSP
jgi:hypothetical protein